MTKKLLALLLALVMVLAMAASARSVILRRSCCGRAQGPPLRGFLCLIAGVESTILRRSSVADAFSSGEGGPFMGDEESRKVAIRLVVQYNINPNLKITNCNITIIAIFIPTLCHYPYSFIPHLLIHRVPRSPFPAGEGNARDARDVGEGLVPSRFLCFVAGGVVALSPYGASSSTATRSPFSSLEKATLALLAYDTKYPSEKITTERGSPLSA